MIKNVLSNLFRWRPSLETLIPTIAGLIVLALSAAMIPASKMLWASIIIRDIAMVLVVGIAFPLFYIQLTGNNFAKFGLTLNRWHIFLPINFVLGVLLLILFLLIKPPVGFSFNTLTFARMIYIILIGVFEVVFFYSFLRSLFERAFGIVPGIILTALFYSFHHMGFQPEYGKLFIVGLMYATIFRLGNSMLLIFPFFLGSWCSL